MQPPSRAAHGSRWLSQNRSRHSLQYLVPRKYPEARSAYVTEVDPCRSLKSTLSKVVTMRTGSPKCSGAVQAALMNTLRVPPEDFYQLIFEFPKKRFLHTPSFVGMHYTDDLIVLEITFIQGRTKETRLALLKDINARVAAAAHVSPDDLM